MKNISVDNMMDPLWGLATRNIYMLCMDMEFWHEDFCEEFLNDFLLFHYLLARHIAVIS